MAEALTAGSPSHLEVMLFMEKSIKIPNADHPITIERKGARVIVSAGGTVIADTMDALSLLEAKYPEVLYVPRKDVDMTKLERTSLSTYCPYKGDCSYYSIPAAGERSVNAVWTYEEPFPAVEAIKDHLAFYPDRVDSITVAVN
jgi:uncharacterized protein (DUF427 family)